MDLLVYLKVHRCRSKALTYSTQVLTALETVITSNTISSAHKKSGTDARMQVASDLVVTAVRRRRSTQQASSVMSSLTLAPCQLERLPHA
jgi:hypothetical protein